MIVSIEQGWGDFWYWTAGALNGKAWFHWTARLHVKRAIKKQRKVEKLRELAK